MVYVDDLQTWPAGMVAPRARRFGLTWCHLTADCDDELHAFAARLGLRRSYFQPQSRPHYDLIPAKRRAAVDLGAEEISRRRRKVPA